MFHIAFKRGEALPLTFVRFWRPHSSRIEGAEQPRHASDSWPRHQPIREFDLPVNRAHVRTPHARAQSATAFRPHTQTQQGILPNYSRLLAPTVREQASAMKANLSQAIRNLGPATTQITPHAEHIVGSRSFRKHSRHRIALSVLPTIQFTVRVRNISSHEHL